VKKYNYEGEFTSEAFLKFYEDFSEGKIQPSYKSEPVSETNDAPVKIVVGKTFASIVLDETKDVLVEFYAPWYAPWCDHCKEVKYSK